MTFFLAFPIHISSPAPSGTDHIDRHVNIHIRFAWFRLLNLKDTQRLLVSNCLEHANILAFISRWRERDGERPIHSAPIRFACISIFTVQQIGRR